MNFNYDLIKKNLATYKEAKEIFPIISEYELGQVNHTTMNKLGLGDFASFGSFLSNCFKEGFNPVMKGMTWRRLKPILIEQTHNERFKKFLFNRTQSQFNQILNDGATFDRYLNGRWITKPGLSRRGRKTYGRRSHEHIESFRICIIPILNYIIDNNIDVYGDSKDYKEHYQSFNNQQLIETSLRWYTNKELDFSNVPKREIDVTRKLLSSLAQIVDDSKIDFRKLNSEYIISSISEKISKLMKVPEGTRLKCLNDFTDMYGQKCLTKDQYYEVRSTSTSNGYVTVLIYDDNNRSNWFQYSRFEDVQSHREDLLNSLFGE
jgi:hypothetical protein